MELSKRDSLMAKGIAILGMLMLHLFCRLDDLPYTPWVWIGGKPLVYYLGLFGDICVPAYCFVSGYAQMLLRNKEGAAYGKRRWGRLAKFLANYWLVLCVFSVVGLLFDKTGGIPGSLREFLGNAFLYGISYNGAWWFVLTYAILVAIAPYVAKIVEKCHPNVLFFLSGGAYFVAYVFRFAYVLNFENVVLNWLWSQLVLLGTSQFAFVLGMLFCQHRTISRLRALPWSGRKKNLVGTALILAVFFLHCLEPSLILAPITGIVTLTCFWLAEKPEWLCCVLYFFGKHSTNIWLVHMFYYLVIFKGLAFQAKYPLFVFVLLLGLSTVTSLVLQPIYELMISGWGKCGK